MKSIFMRNIILTLAVFIYIISASEVLAQKILVNQIIGGVCYVAIIDNGTLPLGVIKMPSELLSQKTNGRTNGRTKRHRHDNVINSKVGYQFAVAKTDMPRMSWDEAAGWDLVANDNDASSVPTAVADTGCSIYTEGDGDIGSWRLPTQRELILIYQMSLELEAIDGFSTFASNKYWSSSESYNNSNSWYVILHSGAINDDGNKSDGYSVRCIRDL